MGRILSRAEIKEKSKVAMRTQYWAPVLSLLIAGAIVSVTLGLLSSITEFSIPLQDIISGEISVEQLALGLFNFIGQNAVFFVLSWIATMLIQPVLECGALIVLLRVYRGQSTSVKDIFEIWDEFWHVLGGLFYQALFLFLWRLIPIAGLFIAVYKAYSYSMTPFLLVNRKEISATEALKTSIRMTDGYKMDLFVLDLSFIGWQILSVLTVGVLGTFYVNPYYKLCCAGYYDELEREVLGSVRGGKPQTIQLKSTAEVQVISGEYAGVSFPLNRCAVTIGRDPKFANIILAQNSHISRRHCSIRFDERTERYLITDMSSYGTFLANGTRLPKNTEIPVRRGTVIYLVDRSEQFMLK